MADVVLFTGRCDRDRKRHVLFRLVETADTLDIVAPKACHDREYETWSPLRRRFDPLNRRAMRYGCACRRSVLVGDDQIWQRLLRGASEWVVATTNISER